MPKKNFTLKYETNIPRQVVCFFDALAAGDYHICNSVLCSVEISFYTYDNGRFKNRDKKIFA